MCRETSCYIWIISSQSGPNLSLILCSALGWWEVVREVDKKPLYSLNMSWHRGCHSCAWGCIEEHRNEAHRHCRAGMENRGAAVETWLTTPERCSTSGGNCGLGDITLPLTLLSTRVHLQYLKNAADWVVHCTFLCFWFPPLWNDVHWSRLVFRSARRELCFSIFSVLFKMSQA